MFIYYILDSPNDKQENKMFIKVTSDSKGDVYLNVNQIEQFFIRNERNRICLNDYYEREVERYINVKETPEQIMQLIEEARK